MNADIEKLRRVIFAMQDVCAAEDRYEWEKEHLFKATSRLSDMPRGGGMSRGIDGILADIDEKESAYKKTCEKYKYELREAEDIVNGIANENMRTFVTLFYVMGMSGEEVRRRLNMTEYAFKQARTAVENSDSMKEVRWNEKL